MNKYTPIVLIIVLVLGLVTGAILTSQKKDRELQKVVENYELELKSGIEKANQQIKVLEGEIKEYQAKIERDSIKIKDFEYKIRLDGVRYEQRLKELRKLNAHEKEDFIINRYTTKPDINQ